MYNFSSVPVILKRIAKNGNLGFTKATAVFSRTWCYTVLEMGRHVTTGDISFFFELYTYIFSVEICMPGYHFMYRESFIRFKNKVGLQRRENSVNCSAATHMRP